METAHDNVRRNDYKEYMKTSMNATAELLDSIERDIEESRQFIQSMNSEERILTQLVSTLKEDNEILLNKVQVLEAELTSMHEQSVRTSNDLYMEFEEKILACNGEIERVVAQCDEANNERKFLKEEVSKLEHLCTGYSDELNQARLSVQSKNFQVQRLQIENEQLKSELSRSKDELKAVTDTHQNTLHRIHALEEQQQPPQQLQEGCSMYPDQDIADIIERVKHLEEQNRILTRSQPSPHPTSSVKENSVASLSESLKSVSLQDVSISKRVVSFDTSMHHQEAVPASSTSLPSAVTRPAPVNSSGLPSAGSAATRIVSSTPSTATAVSPVHSPKAPKGYLTLPDSASSPYTKPYFSSSAMNSLAEQLSAHTNTKHSTTTTDTPTTSTLQPAVTHPEEYSHFYPAHQLSSSGKDSQYSPAHRLASSGSTNTQLASNSSEQEPLHTSRSQLSVSQRHFASPESDEGHPFELEEDYVPPNSRNVTSFTTHKTYISEHSPDHHYRESDFSYSGEYSTPYVTRTSLGSSGQPDSGGSPPFLGLYQSHQVPLQQLESDMSPVVSYLSAGVGTTSRRRSEEHKREHRDMEEMEQQLEEGYRYEAIERSPHSSQFRQSADAPPRRSASNSSSRSSNNSSTSSSPRHITTAINSNQLPAPHSTSMRLSQRPNPDTSYISQEDEDDSGPPDSLSSQPTVVELPQYTEDDANFNENNTENDYPDDFETESYDDNIGGYTDDDQEPLGYRETGNDGEYRSSSGDSNSDDGGMQNVFMYDGSVVEGDSLALDFDPSIGLDELSRLSI